MHGNGRSRRRWYGHRAQRGAALIDAIVSAAILIAVTSGVGHLLIAARQAAWAAGTDTRTAAMAVEKLEQLRSLAWYVDPAGARVSDVTTDVSTHPASGGGSGLQRSPGGTLERNTPRFVDYLDGNCRWCATGARPPAGAAYVRRWAIEPFAPDPADTLILTVLVFPIADPRLIGGRPLRGTRLQTIRTRTVP